MNLSDKRSLSKYSITPKLIRIGVLENIKITPIGKHMLFDDNTEYTVTVVPMEMYDETYIEQSIQFDSFKLHSENGVLSFSYTFPEEQEWIISISCEAEPQKLKKPIQLHVFSLEQDLYELNPYRGDLHAHSVCSDGTEDPAIVAANYRKEGFDFFALTDHHQWQPSDYMIDVFSKIPCGFKMFHGEEVHLRGVIHVVNFGSKYSVNELYKNNAEKYHTQLTEEAKTITTPKYVNPLEYCYRKWIYNEIGKAGGITIVPHPFWIHSPGIYNMNTKMLEYVFKTGIFDAFELVGGQSVHENNIQEAFWQQMRADGVNIPIVGSSDSHGTDKANYFCISKTVVFAKDMELDSIVNAIKNGYSVAIDEPYGEEYRVLGSYRMVKYARFLMEYYFPGHDELCYEEGRLMREYALGDEHSGKTLATLSDRCDKYREETLRAKNT